MNTPGSYYRHSGRVDPRAATVVPPFLILAALAGVVYGLGVRYIPFIFLELLLCAGAGFAFGFIARTACRLGRVRNLAAAVAIGFACAFAGWWANWVVWTASLAQYKIWLLNPLSYPALWRALATQGVLASRGGEPFPAFVHYSVWALEALVLFGLALMVAAGAVTEEVYCETCDRWTGDGRKIDGIEAVAEPDGLRSALERGDFTGLAALRRADPGTERTTRLTLHQCERCGGLHTVAAETVVTGVDAKGKATESTTAWLKALVIDPPTHAALVALAPPPTP